MWYGGFGWGGWLLMSLMMVLFWGLVIFGGIALWRTVGGTGRSPRGPGLSSSEQVLEKRFARGEIDAEEYARRREVLRSGR